MLRKRFITQNKTIINEKYHMRCSKLRLLTGIHARHRRDMDWRTCSKIPGVSRIVAIDVIFMSLGPFQNWQACSIQDNSTPEKKIQKKKLLTCNTVSTLRARIEHHLLISVHDSLWFLAMFRGYPVAVSFNGEYNPAILRKIRRHVIEISNPS